MWFYRLLLHLYPKSFCHEYGDQMCEAHAERARLASGPLATAALWLEAVPDVLTNALCVHWDILRQDLHYTRRTLVRTPGFAATAIVVTALGIGANAAVFSVTDRVFIRPLPFADADRLVKLWQRMPNYPRMEVSPPNYRDWRAMSASFSSMGAFTGLPVNLIGQGDPERLEVGAVTPDVFTTLGVKPALGRVFTPDEEGDGAPLTVVLNHVLWQSAFGGDPGVVGREIRLSGISLRSYTVIGVMPRGFYFPDRDTDLWVPLRLLGDTDRTNNLLQVIARLKPGVSIDGAGAEVATLAASLERAYPRENEKSGAVVIALRDEISSQARLLLIALFVASICVLLIACTNLANLLLTRFLARRPELSVRAAMGAGRERLVRQLLTESLVLSVLGGALGILIGTVAMPLLARLAPASVPLSDPEAFDVRMLTFALLMTFVTGIAFGVVPALRVCRGGDLSALRERTASGIGHRGERLRGALVLAEITASIVLLVASGLLIRALWRVRAVDPGFRTENVLTLRTALPANKYGRTDVRARFYDRVLADVRALPGVVSAGYITFLPMTMTGGIWPVNVKGIPNVSTRGTGNNASLRYVTPGFFATLGIPFRLGRDIAESDTRDAPFAAVVSESFAKRYWPDQTPLGRTFTFALAERTVVGVVADIRVRGLERESEPQVYVAYTQVPDNALTFYAPKDFVVKASGDAMTLLPSIRSIIKKADPELPVTDVRTLADIVDGQTAPRETQVRVLVAFVLVSVVLAGVGIHGLLSFGVSRRKAEIGLRIALGAQRGDVLRMVLREGVMLAVAGCGLGMCLAYIAGRAMHGLLAGVGPADTATFTAAAALAIVMTISGSLAPAIRAVRIDPATALRVE